MVGVTIRALALSEWQAFRAFRLAALKAAPDVFAVSYQESLEFSPARWKDTIEGDDHQVFGLFDGECLVGITAVFTDREDPSGQTALLAMSFIDLAYRGQGLSRLLYESRLAWIKARPSLRRIIVSHRASNEASRRANQRYGFTQTKIVSHEWPDGETEDEVFYEMEIADAV